jgi:hypothetical protein
MKEEEVLIHKKRKKKYIKKDRPRINLTQRAPQALETEEKSTILLNVKENPLIASSILGLPLYKIKKRLIKLQTFPIISIKPCDILRLPVPSKKTSKNLKAKILSFEYAPSLDKIKYSIKRGKKRIIKLSGYFSTPSIQKIKPLVFQISKDTIKKIENIVALEGSLPGGHGGEEKSDIIENLDVCSLLFEGDIEVLVSGKPAVIILE